jgi:DNA-binding MarR family transcriptional regulator
MNDRKGYEFCVGILSMSLVIDALRHAHDISHAALLVLLAITAYVEEHGAPAYPSQATLAKDAGVTERYIEACVQECEQAGYLHVERRREPGKRPRNFYTVIERWRSTPEQVSVKPVHRTSKPLEKKEKQDLQEHRDQGTTIPEPNTPIVTPAATNWLRTLASDLGPDFASVLQGAQPPDARTHTKSPRKPRGEGLYTLGKLCKRGHEHEGTGQSLRRLPSGSCLQCDLERQEAKRQASVQARREAKPARRIIDLAAHRVRQGG